MCFFLTRPEAAEFLTALVKSLSLNGYANNLGVNHMSEKRLGNISSRVLEYLTANVGIDVNVWDIAEATDLDNKRVQYSMGHLRDRNHLPITTLVRGSMWRLEDRTEDRATE